MTQLSLLSPGAGNIETPTVQARVLARADDPATSKAAASKVSVHLSESQERALFIITLYGPGTLREIARDYCERALDPNWIDAAALYHELARRAPELRRAVKIRVQQDPSLPCRGHEDGEPCHCHDVVIEGCRVWEVV